MNQQGSEAWFLDRAGKITGSIMDSIMTGGTQKWITLLNEKKGEIEDPGSVIKPQIKSPPLQWGIDNEPKALFEYEFQYNREVKRVGFIDHPTIDYVGCSPDGDDGEMCLEIKCPYNETYHAMTVLHGTGAETYKAQIQCEIWVMEKQGCTFLSYDPRYKDPSKRLIVIPVERDDSYIEEMEELCAKFWNYLQTDTRPEDIGVTDEIPAFF